MKNRTAIITGGARRIGAAITRELHGSGMDVIVHYNTSGPEAESLTGELNSVRPDSACMLEADLGNIDSIKQFVARACSFRDRVDVLVNNASVFQSTPLSDLDEASWDETININLKAPLFLSKALANALRSTGGTIINLADIYGQNPLNDYLVYSISKAGLIMMTRALAKELAPDIRVNAISPGAILWNERSDQKNREKIIRETLLQRQGDISDITGAIHFLVNNAGYMTGQVLVIDGGRTRGM